MKARRVKAYTYRRHGKIIHVKGHVRRYATSRGERGRLKAGKSGHGVIGFGGRYRRSDGGYSTHNPTLDSKRIARHRAEQGKPFTGD